MQMLTNPTPHQTRRIEWHMAKMMGHKRVRAMYAKARRLARLKDGET